MILGITLLLLGVGMLSCRLGGLAVDLPAGHEVVEWVRTAQGWERSGEWSSSDVAPVSLHPLVVAAGQAMLSILALAYYAESGERLRSNEPAAT
jgi:hypothetical protein